MAQRSKTLAVLAEDPGSIPSITWRFITIHNSSSRGSHTLFWPPRAIGMQVVYKCAYSQNTHTHTIKKLTLLV